MKYIPNDKSENPIAITETTVAHPHKKQGIT